MVDTIKLNSHHYTDLKGLKIGGTLVTATAAELNTMDGITATAAELNAGVLGGVASMTTVATPASQACGVQLVFKDADGVTMAVPTAGMLYISEVATGLTNNPVDSLAVLTNGALDELVTGGASIYTTDATGKLGVTIAHAAGVDSFWIVVVLPNGKLLISDECATEA